jgi:23S rRNA (cytosine1962-C5)-methyltransferase
MAERKSSGRPAQRTKSDHSGRTRTIKSAPRSGANNAGARKRGAAPGAPRAPKRERKPIEESASAVTMPVPEAPSGEYRLLDSGNQRKLERVGPYLLVRHSPQALWSPRLSPEEWDKADGIFHRESDGGGRWEWRTKVKREFDVLYSGLSLELKLTNFGHMGLFPEQAENWEWMRKTIRNRLAASGERNLHVLNLFGYTGGSTLACSQAGAHVVHLDAAKGVVDWARVNARNSKLHERPIRWIVDDAMKFLKREERRGGRYQAVILDPPSFGRGPQGEVFKIEDDIMPLLESCATLLKDDGLFVLYSCHTPGFTPLTMQNQLREALGSRRGEIEGGEMTVREPDGRPLPSGTWARWHADA